MALIADLAGGTPLDEAFARRMQISFPDFARELGEGR
jgi:hypothetical protein